ncbi:DUF5946 family protein [Acidobacteriota bacterium]
MVSMSPTHWHAVNLAIFEFADARERVAALRQNLAILPTQLTASTKNIYGCPVPRREMVKVNCKSTKRAGASERQSYEELQCYTLEHSGSGFIHQHVVDAWAAQHADEQTKPIGLTFALVGLYLHVERGFSGRQVQRVHMKLGRCKRTWPSFPLPRERDSMTAKEVMAAQAGPERDKTIDSWCASVCGAFSESHRPVAELLQHLGIS